VIGTVVGNYKIVEKIGEGGMGAVYKGIDLMLEREVAIKVLRPEFGSQPQVVERFRSEAVTLAKLNHPNIAILYSFFRQSAYFFMVLEYVRGETLDKIIEARGAMSCEEAIPLFCQALEGIDHAHRLGIVHRDIKPGNIMLTDTGILKVLDFGIARMLGTARMTKAGHLIGTIEYMSPEQIRGQEIDARSDIYSLGILLYEMLTGRVPFASDSEFELMRAQVEELPTPPREFAPHIPEDVEWSILCATDKDPEKRFQTAAAFRAAIVDSVGAELMPAPPSWVTGPLNLPAPKTNPISKDATGKFPPPTRMVGVEELTTPPRLSFASRLQALRQHKLFLPLLPAAALAVLLTIGLAVWGVARILSGRRMQEAEVAKQNMERAAEQANRVKTVKEEIKVADPTPPAGMAYVPGGEFMMGTDGGDPYESPAHRVTVRPFFIDLYEVTCEDYEKFISATKHQPPPGWANGTYPPGAARRPVTGVNWDDASEYARWAGKRLPTEEEWEFAARGTDGRRYPWGDEWKENLANVGSINKGMVDIGQYKGESPSGAFDMVGNAWEWTASSMTAYPGGERPQPLSDDDKVIRGGFWGSEANKATVTFRAGWPARSAKDYKSTSFRCAKDVN
jgi:serine/threonine-protein kinase